MKPILFNTEMVRAILEGRKTVTRRVVKPQPDEDGIARDILLNIYLDTSDKQYKPPCLPGDILYVRETWAEMPYGYVYRADDNEPEGWDEDDRWRPSIHMPKEAARIFLRVTGVRVERLRDISASSAMGEGFSDWPEFVKLWDSTVKSADLPLYGWEADPWVWVIKFERINRDEAMKGGGRDD